jgi:prepilin-type N-terminal cleavage/methylation domain-containing protein
MHKQKNAFTLIELMVAMGIIGVLVTLSLLGITIVQRSLRDTQRRDAGSAVRLAIESHYTSNAVYPSSLTPGVGGVSLQAGTGGTITLNGPAKGCVGNAVVSADCTIYCYVSALPNSVYAFGIQLEGGSTQLGNSGTACGFIAGSGKITFN